MTPDARPPASWPALDLPITPPYPPMEARLVPALPREAGWLFEPKWDGFRCVAFRGGDTVALQSKAGQPLTRYFPEVVAHVQALPAARFVLDGELVVPRDGDLSFDDLLQRIHPSASRVRRLSAETPAVFIVFDLLVDDTGTALVDRPLADRRPRLEAFASQQLGTQRDVRLSPATQDRDVAEGWLTGMAGLDGVMAKRLDAPYASGERTAMQKMKRMRTADCVVGGLRWAGDGSQRLVGSLLLGLYDGEGSLNHVGFSSSFTAQERRAITEHVQPFLGGAGFSGHAPGGPSRWSTERSGQWEPLRPELVCEVRYDHWSGDRFRHGTRFLRWRPDQPPHRCTYAQVQQRAGGR